MPLACEFADLGLIQICYVAFLVVAPQFYRALSRESLDKETFCVFLAAYMIAQPDCFERSFQREEEYGLNSGQLEVLTKGTGFNLSPWAFPFISYM